MLSSDLPHAIVPASGHAQGDDRIPVPCWSITKSVLAAAALKLVESGALRLDDIIEDWPFTTRQLLQHTSGLTNYGGPKYQRAVAAGDPVWSVDELLTRRNARQLIFPPGEDWEYSNIGYLFVRQLIERATGEDIDSSLQRLVFGPLAITRTRIAATPSDMGQTRWGNPAGYDPRWVFHGLLIGPPMDAVRFLEGLMTGRIISAPMLATMCGERVLGGSIPGRPWTQIGYGLGLMIGNMDGAGRVLGHSGVGHDSVSALYAFVDLPGRPIVATFAQGTDEGVPETEAVRLVLAA